jgi:N-methylhydantoinase A/oxoprolinase/acetone carboxylase beta subunit
MILGIDVGGTHTDAVLIDHFKVLKKAKVLTNPENLLTSLLEVTTELVDEATIDRLERVVLARTTAELTLLADTERRTLTIAEEGFQAPIPSDFTMEDAVRIGREKLREKLLSMGAVEEEVNAIMGLWRDRHEMKKRLGGANRYVKRKNSSITTRTASASGRRKRSASATTAAGSS